MNPSQSKACCITGPRKIDKQKTESTKLAIKAMVVEAIAQGYTHFISGFANDVDLYFATIVADLKETYNLSLEAAIPYRNCVKNKNAAFHHLLQQCDTINIYAEKYTPGYRLLCNRFMVQASDLVIAVYDGKGRGEPLPTMRYTQAMGKDIKVINI